MHAHMHEILNACMYVCMYKCDVKLDSSVDHHINILVFCFKYAFIHSGLVVTLFSIGFNFHPLFHYFTTHFFLTWKISTNIMEVYIICGVKTQLH